MTAAKYGFAEQHRPDEIADLLQRAAAERGQRWRVPNADAPAKRQPFHTERTVQRTQNTRRLSSAAGKRKRFLCAAADLQDRRELRCIQQVQINMQPYPEQQPGNGQTQSAPTGRCPALGRKTDGDQQEQRQ